MCTGHTAAGWWNCLQPIRHAGRPSTAEPGNGCLRWCSGVVKNYPNDLVARDVSRVFCTVAGWLMERSKTTIKHAIKHKTSPARLAQLLHNCCSHHYHFVLACSQWRRTVQCAVIDYKLKQNANEGCNSDVQVLQDLFYVLLHVLLYLWSLLKTGWNHRVVLMSDHCSVEREIVITFRAFHDPPPKSPSLQQIACEIEKNSWWFNPHLSHPSAVYTLTEMNWQSACYCVTFQINRRVIQYIRNTANICT